MVVRRLEQLCHLTETWIVRQTTLKSTFAASTWIDDTHLSPEQYPPCNSDKEIRSQHWYQVVEQKSPLTIPSSVNNTTKSRAPSSSCTPIAATQHITAQNPTHSEKRDHKIHKRVPHHSYSARIPIKSSPWSRHPGTTSRHVAPDMTHSLRYKFSKSEISVT